jgi:WD40 repeat protein
MTDVACAGFARDSPTVALGSRQGRVEVIDVAASALLWTTDHGVNYETRDRFMYWQGSGEAVNILRVSPDGRTLVLGFIDDQPEFVDLESGRTFIGIGHDHIVWDAAIDPVLGLIATGDMNRRVIIWNIETREGVAELFIGAPVSALEFRSGHLAIGDERGRTYLATVKSGATSIAGTTRGLRAYQQPKR